MDIREIKGRIFDNISVQNILISVFDKSGLEEFVNSLIDINPKVRFLSTGGTYKSIQNKLAVKTTNNLIEIAEYTDFPEMEGGLVKTLHPKIHAGILGERDNSKHKEYLKNELNGAVYIDMVIVNLYPFEKVIAEPDVSFENARGNIDIGGLAMIRAAAKNFPSCAVVCHPNDYHEIVKHLEKNKGSTSFDVRFELAHKAFQTTAKYDSIITNYINKQLQKKDQIKKQYNFVKRLD